MIFFFDLDGRLPSELRVDPDGVELSGRDEARAQAIATAIAMLGESLPGETVEFRVRDESGRPVCLVRAVVEVRDFD